MTAHGRLRLNFPHDGEFGQQGAARIATVPPPLFLPKRRAIGCASARASAVARAMSPAFALALTVGVGSAVGTDAAVFFEARGLTRGAFLLGLRRPAVTLAIPAPAGSVLRQQRKGRAAHH